MSISNKTELNTINSTETEVVVVCEKLNNCVYFCCFWNEQSGCANEDVLNQDHTSVILLLHNDMYSAWKGSKHIHIRC